jgi:hypothetical protein
MTAPSRRISLVPPPPESAPDVARRADSRIVPRAVVRPEALRYRLLHPRDAGPADVALMGEAYRCWEETWRLTFGELENRPDVRSDDFTRQDEIGALFHEYECIALTFYRWIDLASPIARNDSYFAVWPEGARDAACAHGARICVSSNFTIAAPWRRAAGCTLKDVVGALVVERFLASPADAVVGTMRTDRGMSRMTDRLGFRRLRGGVVHHGVGVDLVVFYRDACTRPPLDPVDEAILQALSPTGARR